MIKCFVVVVLETTLHTLHTLTLTLTHTPAHTLHTLIIIGLMVD